jgi:hypothetical protein
MVSPFSAPIFPLSDYLLLHEVAAPLGAGGMGEVWKARDTRLGRDVAIKVLPEEFAAETERRQRFEREARAMASLSHPNVISIFDVGVHEKGFYIVEELLEGESLRGRLGTVPFRGVRPWRSQRRSRAGSPRPTNAESCTAISSPRTPSSPPMGRSRSSTSASQSDSSRVARIRPRP